MPANDTRQAQIAHTHAELIHLAVAVRQDPDLAPALFERFQELEDAGWSALVKATIDFINGETVDLARLDEEDRTILAAMQRALDDPDFLDQLQQDISEQAAAPLAALIFAATQGEREALEALDSLRQAADTATARATCNALIAMIEGERQPERLSAKLPEAQACLIRAIVAELVRLECGDEAQGHHAP